jgi:hypothetical protein
MRFGVAIDEFGLPVNATDRPAVELHEPTRARNGPTLTPAAA